MPFLRHPYALWIRLGVRLRIVLVPTVHALRVFVKLLRRLRVVHQLLYQLSIHSFAYSRYDFPVPTDEFSVPVIERIEGSGHLMSVEYSVPKIIRQDLSSVIRLKNYHCGHTCRSN